jgi:hypothetical protein
MKARIRYLPEIEIERSEGSIYLPMNDQIVEAIGTLDGGNISICKTIGFPWEGTLYIRKDYLEIIE